MQGAVLIPQNKDYPDLKADFELTEAYRDILRHMSTAEGGMTAKTLMDVTGIASATIYRHIKALSEAEYIDRKDGLCFIRDDGRAVLNEH